MLDDRAKIDLLETMVHAALKRDERFFCECLGLHTNRLLSAGYSREEVKMLAETICDRLCTRQPRPDPS
ncbi:hypothetical protein WDZ92_34045 [Nostoc sp. NIES-2111]